MFGILKIKPMENLFNTSVRSHSISKYRYDNRDLSFP